MVPRPVGWRGGLRSRAITGVSEEVPSVWGGLRDGELGAEEPERQTSVHTPASVLANPGGKGLEVRPHCVLGEWQLPPRHESSEGAHVDTGLGLLWLCVDPVHPLRGKDCLRDLSRPGGRLRNPRYLETGCIIYLTGSLIN